ncbi:hypothetical protein PQR02_25445, partial [Paraburkholderia sediminicola]
MIERFSRDVIDMLAVDQDEFQRRLDFFAFLCCLLGCPRDSDFFVRDWASRWVFRMSLIDPFPAGQIKAVDGGFSGWISHLPIRVGRRVFGVWDRHTTGLRDIACFAAKRRGASKAPPGNETLGTGGPEELETGPTENRRYRSGDCCRARHGGR